MTGKYAIFVKYAHNEIYEMLGTFNSTFLENAMEMPILVGDMRFFVMKAITNVGDEKLLENTQAYELDWVSIRNPRLRVKNLRNNQYLLV